MVPCEQQLETGMSCLRNFSEMKNGIADTCDSVALRRWTATHDAAISGASKQLRERCCHTAPHDLEKRLLHTPRFVMDPASLCGNNRESARNQLPETV